MKSHTPKNKRFKFKQFSIDGGQAGMPVSTDGVLLGSWAFTHHPKTILDIGTGTGLLALMCAQRFSNAQIRPSISMPLPLKRPNTPVMLLHGGNAYRFYKVIF